MRHTGIRVQELTDLSPTASSSTHCPVPATPTALSSRSQQRDVQPSGQAQHQHSDNLERFVGRGGQGIWTPNQRDQRPRARTAEVTAARRQVESLGDAAERTGLSIRTIRRRIAGGVLTAHRSGPWVIRVDPLDVDRMMVRIPRT